MHIKKIYFIFIRHECSEVVGEGAHHLAVGGTVVAAVAVVCVVVAVVVEGNSSWILGGFPDYVDFVVRTDAYYNSTKNSHDAEFKCSRSHTTKIIYTVTKKNVFESLSVTLTLLHLVDNITELSVFDCTNYIRELCQFAKFVLVAWNAKVRFQSWTPVFVE